MIGITPLDAWTADQAQIGRGLTGSSWLDALRQYQLRKLNETIDHARRSSPFYRDRLASLPQAPLGTLAEFAGLPFTSASDLAGNPASFLSVSQDDIARVVTLRSSGSTGPAKRLFFTEADLESTVDFFHHGMSTLVRPGQMVMIFLPGESPDSVGDLLARGLRRMKVPSVAYGPVVDPSHAVAAAISFGAHCIVGIPTQILALARSPTGAAIGHGRIESVLLSTDYVPRALAKTLQEIWGCRVFTHYGMTEMGLGGGVECEALAGYHLREGDLYFEVIDRETGAVCADGELGEVVFTTLTRKGMPLIRYRTGDVARIIAEPCPCGSALRRMEQVRGRWSGAVRLAADCILTLPELDEALFALPGLLDYRVSVSKTRSGRFRLLIEVKTGEGSGLDVGAILRALDGVEAIRIAVAGQKLVLPGVRFRAGGPWAGNGVAKRQIVALSDTLA